MEKLKRYVLWLLPLAALIVVVIMWPVWPSYHEGRPECPHDWPEKYPDLFISGRITNVPEYHDCQRFLVDDGKGGLKYDSLEAIFVRYQLDTVYRTYFFLNADSVAADSVGRKTNPNGLQVIGQVLSYGDYTPLGIKKGSNCLVLRWETTRDTTTYDAWMVGVGDDHGKCRNPANLLVHDPHAVKLGVALLPTVGVVPPVSRWDWDSKKSLEYIGIACPTGWCEIHEPGPYLSSPIYSQSHDPITKGLYDEQYLATDVSGKLLHDGTTFGTIYPDPRLALQTIDTYKNWQPVAWVALHTASDAYQRKLNFDPAPPLNVPLRELATGMNSKTLNEVELCFVPNGQTRCGGAGDPLPKNCTFDIKNKGRWYARETPPKGVDRPSTITCTEFRFYSVQAPAVVRWRWQKNDETMWISCPSGCCEVKAKN